MQITTPRLVPTPPSKRLDVYIGDERVGYITPYQYGRGYITRVRSDAHGPAFVPLPLLPSQPHGTHVLPSKAKALAQVAEAAYFTGLVTKVQA